MKRFYLRIFFCISILISTHSILRAETFKFKFTEGESYRINSIVQEIVTLDGNFSHSAEIANRISVTVSDVKTTEGLTSAEHNCTFMTSEKNSNRTFEWGQQYESVFRRDETGRYDISDEYFMPVVRDVPVFPDYDIKRGDRWQASGEEAHDFRLQFGLEKPFKVPFTADYLYLGEIEENGRIFHCIEVEYTLFFDTPVPPAGRNGTVPELYPVSVKGFSHQQLYWDNEKGALSHYNEEFNIQLDLNTGSRLNYRGTAEAVVSKNEALDRDKIVREMDEEISRQGIKNTRVTASEEGVTISMEAIRFVADSSEFLPGEEEKIRRIAKILSKYPDNDLLVSGHTALAGTPEARQSLSEERAEAVAGLLIALGVRKRQNIFTKGFGAERPCAPNDTEENRARNRRVEITILEK